MEQFEIRMRPEQLTCHASQLFEDIAQSLLDFAKSIGRCARMWVGLLLTTCSMKVPCSASPKPPEPA